ncbi:MAG: hypothetical protein SW833_23425 [Cyanobacteriota bacterium]|nr:hypothetical protein [Cyanobacteriota bacterium]
MPGIVRRLDRNPLIRGMRADELLRSRNWGKPAFFHSLLEAIEYSLVGQKKDFSKNGI